MTRRYKKGESIGLDFEFIRYLPTDNKHNRRIEFKCHCGNIMEGLASNITGLQILGCGCTKYGNTIEKTANVKFSNGEIREIELDIHVSRMAAMSYFSKGMTFNIGKHKDDVQTIIGLTITFRYFDKQGELLKEITK